MPGTAIDGPEKMKVEVTALTVHSSESTFFRSEYITEALEVPADFVRYAVLRSPGPTADLPRITRSRQMESKPRTLRCSEC